MSGQTTYSLSWVTCTMASWRLRDYTLNSTWSMADLWSCWVLTRSSFRPSTVCLYWSTSLSPSPALPSDSSRSLRRRPSSVLELRISSSYCCCWSFLEDSSSWILAWCEKLCHFRRGETKSMRTSFNQTQPVMYDIVVNTGIGAR